MSSAAVVTMILAVLLVGGGLAASIVNAVRSERRDPSSGPRRDT